MSIQGAISGALGAVGQTMAVSQALKQQTPEYKAKVEEELRKQQVARWDKEADISERALYESGGTEENPKYDPRIAQNEASRLYSLRQELFRSDPTQERFKAYTGASERLFRVNETPNFTVANKGALNKQAMKQAQRTAAQEHISNWGKPKRPKA